MRGLIGTPPRIYDDVPQEEGIFPYITLGDVKTTPIEGSDHGFEHDCRFHIWSRFAGHREVKAIQQAVHDALHNKELPLSGGELISLRFIFSDTFRKQDGETYHAVMRFRAITMGAAI